jgi:hypothetical protein
MNARSKSIAKEAETLPAIDRIWLVERLLASLDRSDPDIDRIWADEGERRTDAYLRGETSACDAKDVLAKYCDSANTNGASRGAVRRVRKAKRAHRRVGTALRAFAHPTGLLRPLRRASPRQ